ncbi:hypothetical protein C1646_664228 [Rhizophagus diaphanus]|nr:hypothetical protein C1646_664228 [Rhizophagus diaphanus] [Rhizophagus sp. MUCL 43196]
MVKYLKYKKKFTLPTQEYYDYHIPYSRFQKFFNHRILYLLLASIKALRCPPPSTDPLDGIDIPEELKPFVPKGPVYVKRLHVVHVNGRDTRKPLKSGSKKWLAEIRLFKRQHDKKVADEQQAKLLGTSVTSLSVRLELMRDLTDFQNLYDEKMGRLTTRRPTKMKRKVREELESSYNKFKLDCKSFRNDDGFYNRRATHQMTLKL